MEPPSASGGTPRDRPSASVSIKDAFGGISTDFWSSLELPEPGLDAALDELQMQPAVPQPLQDSPAAYGSARPTAHASSTLAPAPASSLPVFPPNGSLREYKSYITDIFAKMMFVSGETAEPSAETTWLIEEIVREQVVHMVST